MKEDRETKSLWGGHEVGYRVVRAHGQADRKAGTNAPGCGSNDYVTKVGSLKAGIVSANENVPPGRLRLLNPGLIFMEAPSSYTAKL